MPGQPTPAHPRPRPTPPQHGSTINSLPLSSPTNGTPNVTTPPTQAARRHRPHRRHSTIRIDRHPPAAATAHRPAIPAGPARPQAPIWRHLAIDPRLATRPAECFICDGFGPHAAASPVDGAIYQLEAIDEATSSAYIRSVRQHTVDAWVDFLRSVLIDARALGHSPYRRWLRGHFTLHISRKQGWLPPHWSAWGRGESGGAPRCGRLAAALGESEAEGARGRGQMLFRRVLALAGMARGVASLHVLPSTPLPYRGVLVDLAEDPTLSTSFSELISGSLKAWRAQGLNSVMLRVPIEESALCALASRHGFEFHHAAGGEAVLKCWLCPDREDKVPPFATHQVGGAGFVLSESGEILVVKEWRDAPDGQRVPSTQWKLPGGLLDRGESFEEGIAREVCT